MKIFSPIHLFYFFIPLNYDYKFHEYGLVSIYIKVILISTMHRAPICKFHWWLINFLFCINTVILLYQRIRLHAYFDESGYDMKYISDQINLLMQATSNWYQLSFQSGHEFRYSITNPWLSFIRFFKRRVVTIREIIAIARKMWWTIW